MLTAPTRFLSTAVGELADAVGHGPEEAAPHVLEVDALFERCRSTFGAAVVLLENDYADEAVMLGRGLFTDSLVLAELAAVDDERRAEIMVGRSLTGIASIEGLLLGQQARGEDVREELGWVALARSHVEQYARDRGVGTRHWKPDEKALAEAHGRGPQYVDFRLAHLFVHGGRGGAMRRYGAPDDDPVTAPAADDPTEGSRAALFACESLLYACRATLRIRGEPEPDEVGMFFALGNEIQRSWD